VLVSVLPSFAVSLRGGWSLSSPLAPRLGIATVRCANIFVQSHLRWSIQFLHSESIEQTDNGSDSGSHWDGEGHTGAEVPQARLTDRQTMLLRVFPRFLLRVGLCVAQTTDRAALPAGRAAERQRRRAGTGEKSTPQAQRRTQVGRAGLWPAASAGPCGIAGADRAGKRPREQPA
jgi:hypothetical protein